MLSASIASNAATGTGFVAASIAVLGFLLHAAPALSGAPERRIRKATVAGGLLGFVASFAVILLSAIVS